MLNVECLPRVHGEGWARPQRWALNVECSAFLSAVLFALSAAAQSATGPLPPLIPPYGQLQPTFWEQHGTGVVLGGLLLVVLTGAAFWILSRPKPPVVLPPEVVAREALRRLRGQPETGTVLSQISQILRRGLAAILELPPGELTNFEFAVALRSKENVDAAQAQEIVKLLRQCDERKFAPGISGAPLNAADRALAIIAEIEKQKAKLLVQDQTKK